MVKIATFNDRPVRHVRYMLDGTVILKLYERRSGGRARHLRVSLSQWLVGRGVYLWRATPRGGSRPVSSPAVAAADKNIAVFAGTSTRE